MPSSPGWNVRGGVQLLGTTQSTKVRRRPFTTRPLAPLDIERPFGIMHVKGAARDKA